MIKSGMFRLLLLLALPLATGAVAQDRVGDFSLLDQAGYHHGMSWYGDHELIAFLVQANDSAATEAALPRYLELHKQYDAHGVEFMMINPMARYNREAVQARLDQWGVEIPVLMDDSQVVSEAMGIERQPAKCCCSIPNRSLSSTGDRWKARKPPSTNFWRGKKSALP